MQACHALVILYTTLSRQPLDLLQHERHYQERDETHPSTAWTLRRFASSGANVEHEAACCGRWRRDGCAGGRTRIRCPKDERLRSVCTCSKLKGRRRRVRVCCAELKVETIRLRLSRSVELERRGGFSGRRRDRRCLSKSCAHVRQDLPNRKPAHLRLSQIQSH